MQEYKARVIAGGIRLPNSYIQVLAVLSGSKDGVSQQQLIKGTGLSERAVKYALKRLVVEKLVSEQANIGDLRRKMYEMEG